MLVMKVVSVPLYVGVDIIMMMISDYDCYHYHWPYVYFIALCGNSLSVPVDYKTSYRSYQIVQLLLIIITMNPFFYKTYLFYKKYIILLTVIYKCTCILSHA